jgi:co-chaperonin GroES (HSP10)
MEECMQFPPLRDRVVVECSALQDASVAGLLITTETVVAVMQEKKTPSA